jgi:hypothetical protein
MRRFLVVRAVAVIAVSVAATYPLALAAHMAVELLQGDALLLREWQYGSRRAVALDLLGAWAASLAWVLGIWLALAVLRRWLGSAYPWAVGGASVVLVGLALLAPGAVPSLLAWLLLTAFVLAVVARALISGGAPA